MRAEYRDLMLRPHQSSPAGNKRSPFLPPSPLQFDIIIEPGPASYRCVSQWWLVGDHFQHSGPNIMGFYYGRAVQHSPWCRSSRAIGLAKAQGAKADPGEPASVQAVA
jgi:hypothetical protein